MPAAALSVPEIDAVLRARHDVDVWHWRADTPALEICAGAILVQHTAWANVERALANLRAAEILSLPGLEAVQEEDLATVVRPAGLPATKARRLKTFAALAKTSGGLAALLAQPAAALREVLLATSGIGPETADVILLYAAKRPVPVHDAYTARLYRRLGLGPESQAYATWRGWLDKAWPAGLEFRRRHHAAIVLHCKEICRARPRCWECPLAAHCQFAPSATASEV